MVTFFGSGGGVGSGSCSGFTIPTTVGLVAWIDACVAANFTISAGAVQTALDRSSNAYVFSSGSVGAQYLPTGFNSRPTLEFAGTASQQSLSYATAALGTGNTLTIFAACTLGTDSNGFHANGPLASYTAAAAGGAYNNLGSFGLINLGAANNITFDRNGVTQSTTVPYNTPMRVIFTLKSDGTRVIYINGVAVSTVAGAVNNWVSPGYLSLGGSQFDSSLFGGNYAGLVSEWGVYSTYADPTAVGLLDTYLKNKWGMADPVGASCAEATAFLARTSGLDATHRAAYGDLICGLVTDGIWTKLDALYIFATQDLATARLNLVSSTYNATGGTNFVVDNGVYGNSGSHDGMLNTNFNPTTAVAPKYTRNNAHYSVWSVDINTPHGFAQMGMEGGAGFQSLIYTEFADTLTYWSINGGTGNTTSTAVTLGQGQFIVNRSGAGNVELYNKGSLTSSIADASTAPANQPFYVCGVNNNGTGNASQTHIPMASIGASLTAGEATLFYNRLRTYMTAVGVP